jgi:hypothetical protein
VKHVCISLLPFISTFMSDDKERERESERNIGHFNKI